MHLDRRLSTRAMAVQLNLDKETVRQILSDNLGMKKVLTKMVPWWLTNKNSSTSMYVLIFLVNWQTISLSKLITWDEIWCFQYDLESKWLSLQWKQLTSSWSKKAYMSKSQMKTMLITLFNIKGIVQSEIISYNQTVNQAYYMKYWSSYVNNVCKKGPELWLNSWIIHHYNAPAHKAFSFKQFLTPTVITEIEYSPYSPHLAPNDFWLFSQIKSALKGRRFQVTEDIT